MPFFIMVVASDVAEVFLIFLESWELCSCLLFGVLLVFLLVLEAEVSGSFLLCLHFFSSLFQPFQRPGQIIGHSIAQLKLSSLVGPYQATFIIPYSLVSVVVCLEENVGLDLGYQWSISWLLPQLLLISSPGHPKQGILYLLYQQEVNGYFEAFIEISIKENL